MQKVVITKSGKPCYISGPGAKNLTITAYDAAGKIDEVVEEFEIVADPTETERLRKLNTVKEWRKKHIRKLYKRGDSPQADKIRDENAQKALRLHP